MARALSPDLAAQTRHDHAMDAVPRFAEGYALWGLALVGVIAAFALWRWIKERRALGRHAAALDGGAGEPVSLHPVIDPMRCVGCSACTNACPEGKIIEMIGGKAQLIDAASCIGHGACKTACPVNAIELVFGSARRGVDIPVVQPNFETSVPGVFIAGELGGMGLIANAIEQGRQAMDAIARLDGLKRKDRYDAIIVGAGPAGISASLAAKEKGLSVLTLEQDSLGGTVAKYPRGKIAMTRPARLPLYGKVRFRRVRKERLLALWDSVIRKTGIAIHDRVRVERIARSRDGFDVETSAGVFSSRAVLLATGRRGAPKRLGIAGEELAKTRHGLDDAKHYVGRHVLVVGAGDSALEAVAALARQPLASVTLAIRGTDVSRARDANRQMLDDVVRQGRVKVLKSAAITAIEPKQVRLTVAGRATVLPNDDVIICIGGVLPTELLNHIGVTVETRYGTA
jgi:thioredoxin reductase (NADPH)